MQHRRLDASGESRLARMQLDRTGRFVRRSIKRFIYSQLALREAFMILFRKSAPLVMFNVEDDPPSIYINFRVRSDRVEPLADELDLPDGLTLTPIRCLDAEEPFHAITLNAYRVSGLVSGVRAEWSTYVRDAKGVPRYLVVEAQSDVGSMDPVHIVTRAGSMEHTLDGDRLRTRVVAENQGEFVLDARLPAPTDRETLQAAPEWIGANDFIYWRNGVCDRTFYDAALARAPLWRVPPESLQVRDGTAWREFVDPEPVHALVLSKRTQFAMSPWWNV
jgi:hypothetical protein